MTDKKDRSFNEQAYVIWDHFVRTGKSRKPGSNLTQGQSSNSQLTLHKIDGNYEPANFISKILNKKNKLDTYKSLLDLETHKISYLVPEVRLSKIKDDKYTPFYFPVASENTTMTSMLQPGSSIGGSGIKSFDVKFVGKDFFTRDKTIQCSLSIFVDSLENIFRDPPTGYAPLAELFTISRKRKVPLREGFSKEVSSDQVNKATSHEIVANLGYSSDRSSDVFTNRERQAIENTSLSVRMTYTGHNISINQDGTATIDVTFIGRLSGVLEDPLYNVLSDSTQLIALGQIQKEKDDIRSNEKPDTTETKEAIEKLDAQIKKSIRSTFKKYTDMLQEDGKVHRLTVKQKDFEEFAEYFKEPADEPTEKTKTATQKPPESTATPTNSGPTSDTPDTKAPTKKSRSSITVEYVYAGDFIQAVIAGTEKSLKDAISEIDSGDTHASKKKNAIEPLQKALVQLPSFKVLFGQLPVITDKYNYRMTNIADIPISMKIVGEYIFENIEQKHVTRLSLNSFFDDFVGKILPSALSKHLPKDASKLPSRMEVKSVNVTAPNSKELGRSSNSTDIKKLPDMLKSVNTNRRKKDDVDYMIVYTDISDKSSPGLKGEEAQDTSNGVYHFNLSKDRGMVKSISFAQNTVKYRKEALMLESVSLYDELKLPYNANITMFGNGLFLPGSMIYINPSSLGFGDPRNKRSAAARLGIGGYYIVISVSTSFNNGQMTTTLTTQHQDWASEDTRISTAEELQSTGIFDKAKRIVERETGEKSPIQRLF
jgi:hypothetical protein